MAFCLARAYGPTFYDSLYLELAVRRRTALAALDDKLGRAASAGCLRERERLPKLRLRAEIRLRRTAGR